MSDIKMSLVNRFFGTSLPYVRTEDFATGSENNVGSGVMGHKL
jgi:hypothetical protein